MGRRFLNQLGDSEQVEEIYLASEKQLRPNRNGNLYLQVRLSDRTGSVTGMLWNAGEREYRSFENGDFVQIEGNAQVYNGKLQIILTDIHRAEPGQAESADFYRLGPAEIDRMVGRLAELLRSVQNEPLRSLVECFLGDAAFMKRFARAPAGVKNHHAYPGGLLEHVVSLMEVCAVVAPRYPKVDRDLLLVGAFLHDSGKIDELAFERDLSYTDEGQLIGHLVIAVGYVDGKIAEVEKLTGADFPLDLAVRIKHMVVSHHGEYEHGSPKLPMTLEAVTLHLLDTLDARLHNFQQIMEEDQNADSVWTTYQPTIGRKLYKG